jgi:hypothetical protein
MEEEETHIQPVKEKISDGSVKAGALKLKMKFINRLHSFKIYKSASSVVPGDTQHAVCCPPGFLRAQTISGVTEEVMLNTSSCSLR